MVFISLSDIFIKNGLGDAFVQKKEVSILDESTVFISNLALSVVLYAILWIVAPFISIFYEEPNLIDMFRVLGIILVINSFNVIQYAKLKRTLNFKLRSKITLFSLFVSGILAIVLAKFGFGAWSLIYKYILNAVIITIGLAYLTSWRPVFKFSAESFNKLVNFGGWILAGHFLRTLFNNIYAIVIGKFYSLSELGLYDQSKKFQVVASQNVSEAISSVSFPVLSKYQDDDLKFTKSVKKFLKLQLIVVAPIMIAFAITAREFVLFFLTSKWIEIIPYIQLLCISGFLFPINLMNVQILLAKGKSKLNFNLITAKSIFRVLGILVSYKFGLYYIILSDVILSFIFIFINSVYNKRIIGLGVAEQIKELKFILLSATISLLASIFIIRFLQGEIVVLILGAISSTLIFYVLLLVFDSDLKNEVKNLLNNLKRY